MSELTLRPSDATNLAGQDTGREHLSHSSLSLFLACRRKYQLDKIERLSLIARPRYFDMGSAFQKAIELQDPTVGPRVLRGWMPCDVCKGAAGWMDQAALDAGLLGSVICPACKGTGGTQGDAPPIADQDDEDRLRIEETIVQAAAELYMRKWPANAREHREYEYRVRLRNPATGAYSLTFDLLGYADGMVDAGGWLELDENKLRSQITALDVRRLPLDRQLALERYGLWRATGKPVRRVRYRWIRKPSIKQRAGRKADRSDAESIDQFCERIAADYRDREDFYSHEEAFFVGQDDLLRVEAELWSWAEQLRQARRRGFWDRNTSVCHEYGGCAFLAICGGDPDAMSLYRRRPEHERPAQPVKEQAA